MVARLSYIGISVRETVLMLALELVIAAAEEELVSAVF